MLISDRVIALQTPGCNFELDLNTYNASRHQAPLATAAIAKPAVTVVAK